MALFLVSPVIDSYSQQNFDKIKYILNGGLGFDNFSGLVISGVTSSSAHTLKQFKHSLKEEPAIVFTTKGNIYIFEKTIDFVDIRSSQTDVSFEVLLVRG